VPLVVLWRSRFELGVAQHPSDRRTGAAGTGQRHSSVRFRPRRDAPRACGHDQGHE
jgi:hypothetical protein